MLTKTDLKAIGDLVDTKLDQKFDSKLEPIKKDIRKIKNDLSTSIKLTDRLQVYLENRVKTIEKTLKIPTSEFI